MEFVTIDFFGFLPGDERGEHFNAMWLLNLASSDLRQLSHCIHTDHI
jgi:hypothetical protein